VRGLRGWTTVPIIILSGRSESRAKVQALDAGADDYVTKPFNVDELAARVRAVTRRRNATEGPPVVRLGAITVDVTNRRVTREPGGDGQRTDVRLTRTEWQLLEILLRNPGRLITQRE